MHCVDLASERVGGETLTYSDDFFAGMENLIKPGRGIFIDDKFKLYSYNNIEIFVGDFFDLSTEILGDVDFIYDRAALVALPEYMRKMYVEHLLNNSKEVEALLL